MSSPAEPTDPITQLNEVLATAERHVQDIVAAAEHRANERLRDAQAQLDARAAELNSIADELLTASAAVHHQLQRLRSLVPLAELPADEPTTGAPTAPAEPAVGGLRPAAAAPRAVPAAEPFAADLAASHGATAVTAVPDADPGPVPSPHHDHDLPIIGSSGHGPASPPTDQLDSARLVALSMAASGRSRSDVEAHLRNELGIVDSGPLIDYVFGISTPASVVPSWPPRRRRRND